MVGIIFSLKGLLACKIFMEDAVPDFPMYIDIQDYLSSLWGR
jgi:hypothetical protein